MCPISKIAFTQIYKLITLLISFTFACCFFNIRQKYYDVCMQKPMCTYIERVQGIHKVVQGTRK